MNVRSTAVEALGRKPRKIDGGIRRHRERSRSHFSNVESARRRGKEAWGAISLAWCEYHRLARHGAPDHGHRQYDRRGLRFAPSDGAAEGFEPFGRARRITTRGRSPVPLRGRSSEWKAGCGGGNMV